MAKIDELLQELCPDGVDYVKIQEVCVRQKGMNITAQRMCELDNPNGQIKIFAAGSTVAMFNEADVPSQCIIRKPSIIVKSRGNIGFEYCIVPFSHKNEMWSYSAIDNKIDLKYLYHLLLSKTDLFQFIARSNAVKLPQLCVKDTDCYEIPLPPLPIQHYIVEALDTFTDAISNLEEELALREKQFEYYREQLLSFDDETSLGKQISKASVSYFQLGKISNLKRGIRVVKKDLNESDSYPVFQNSLTPLGYFHSTNVPQNSTFIIMAGAAGEVGFTTIPCWAADDCFYLETSEILTNKYVYYFLIKSQHYLKSKVRKASIPRLSRDVIEKMEIPVPSLQRQQEIVEILDTFEAMIANIKEEIALRTKQYEYYREKLLSFGK